LPDAATLPQEAIMAVKQQTVEHIEDKEQHMFPTAHPDFTGQLANERAAGLRADAQRFRRARPFLARWRPARFLEPAADLSRIVPVPDAEAADAASAKAGRAA
jgi:hypothetical protein